MVKYTNAMQLPSIRSTLLFFLTVCFIFGASFTIIAYGRGYRLDVRKNAVNPTGLISATSDPVGAQVLIDTKLKTATNNAFNIEPGWYTVRIIREGYIGWEKKLRIQGEVVTRADAYLFPTNPSLSPLTTTGIEHPILSPDGSKIAYTIPFDVPRDGTPLQAGLWVLDLVDRPLGRNRDPQLVGQSEGGFNLSNAQLVWSPDSTEIMAILPSAVRLYSLNNRTNFTDVSLRYSGILSTWQEETALKNQQKLAGFKEPFTEVASSSGRIIAFSPDETKLLYEATESATIPRVLDPPMIGTNPTEENRTITAGKFYIYDSKEDKNYFVLDKNELLTLSPTPIPRGITRPSPIPSQDIRIKPIWFPTSRHLILLLEGKIDVMEYDRTNWTTIYSGPFVNGFVAPWTNGSRLIIMTNLNPGVGSLPNLYTINLR